DRTRGLWGNHRRRPARRRPYAAGSLDRETRAAARGVRVVSRSAPLRNRAARRVWPRHRAHGGLDLRASPRARDDPVPTHARAAHAIGAVARRRFPTFFNFAHISDARRRETKNLRISVGEATASRRPPT